MVRLRHAAPAIVLTISAMACFSLADVFAKQLTARLPAAEIVWFRYVGLIATVLVLLRGRRQALRSSRLGLQALRACAMTGSAVLYILALGHLPIAEATALSFASPFIVTVLSVWVLKERVATIRWAVVIAAFAGVLIVMRPGTSGFTYWAL